MNHLRKVGRKFGMRGIAAGILTFILTFFALLSSIAFLQGRGVAPVNQESLLAKAVFGISVLLGAWICARVSENRILNIAICTISSVVYVCILVSVLNRGESASFFPAGMIALTASVLGGCLGRKKQFRYK